MIQDVILAIFSLLFAFLTWRNFKLALILFFFLLPSHMIRFQIGPVPTTLLEIMLLIITVIWLIKHNKSIISDLRLKISEYRNLFIAIFLFLLAATISIFVSTNFRAAVGEWKAFYIEPIILFAIIITTQNQWPDYKDRISDLKFKISDYHSKIFNLQSSITIALTLSALLTSVLAIYQHFTGWMVPWDFWDNRNTFRVTAWYGFPNAVGLFLAPILPLTFYLISQTWQKIKSYKLTAISYKKSILTAYNLQLTAMAITITTSVFAIVFAKSTGALVGLVAGLIFFLFFYNKKTRIIACLIGLVGITGLFITPANNPIKQEVLMQDRSGQLRINMWAETTEFLKTHPIVGAGLASYAELIQPYRINKKIEVFHHPHNLFLTMWVNLGLLGLFAFVWIVVAIFNFLPAGRQGKFLIFKQFNNLSIFNLCVLSSLVIILVMGLVDSPYIKNDLSILFWLLPALLLNSLPLVGGGQKGVSKSQKYERLENNQT